MRIAFISFGANLYGANRSMLDLIVGLQKRGVAALVILPENGPLIPRLDAIGVETHIVPFRNGVHWNDNRNYPFSRLKSFISNGIRSFIKSIYNFVAKRQLSLILRRWKADTVVTNTIVITLGASVAHSLRIPHVWHVREFGNLDWDFFPDYGFRQRRAQMKATDLVIFISKSVALHHLKQLGNGSIRKYVVIPNGIGLRCDLMARSARRPVELKPFRFIIVGLVKHSKGQFEAISALAGLIKDGYNATLVIAGGGATTELVNHATKEDCTNQVEVLGHMDNLDDTYRDSDCGLMCSYNEGFGRVTVEYMSWGIPVIGRDSGATSELIKHGETGYLYDGSVMDLKRQMIAVIEDKETSLQVAVAAKRNADSEYSIETYAERFIKSLESINIS